MQNYLVEWKIDIEAESPLDAARKALETQRDPASIALVFDITDEEGHWSLVDLLMGTEE